MFCLTIYHLTLDFEVRLVGGAMDDEGRVEVFHDGAWGTVCDDSWDGADAVVVCRSLGFTGGAEALSEATFGEGTGGILLDNVFCIGTELSLNDCGYNGWGSHDCDHSNDAGVRCSDNSG